MNAQRVLIAAMLWDILTTITGLMVGLKESNPLGLLGVMIFNLLAIWFFYYHRNTKIPRWMSIVLYIVALSRFLAGINNLYLVNKSIGELSGLVWR